MTKQQAVERMERQVGLPLTPAGENQYVIKSPTGMVLFRVEFIQLDPDRYTPSGRWVCHAGQTMAISETFSDSTRWGDR